MCNSVTEDIEFINKYVIDNINASFVAMSAIHGFGLFAHQDISLGVELGLLDGQIMSWKHHNNLAKKIKSDLGQYGTYFFMEWNVLDGQILLVRPFRTKYSYINHSRNPNLQLTRTLPLKVLAIKDVSRGDELTLDYRNEPLSEEYLENHGKTYL